MAITTKCIHLWVSLAPSGLESLPQVTHRSALPELALHNPSWLNRAERAEQQGHRICHKWILNNCKRAL